MRFPFRLLVMFLVRFLARLIEVFVDASFDFGEKAFAVGVVKVN